MKLPEKYRYIVVEGNIGAGKTSLARKIALDFGGTPLLEEFAENSFLPQFYRDPEKFAFPLELSFLAARYKQLTHNIDLLENRFIISDYHIRKSLLFAEFNLAPEELRLFESFYEIVTSRIPEPDLVIYLDKGVEKLQTNIISRGRQFESEISSGYLSGIQHSYHDLIKKYPFNRLVIIDSENMDFVNNENDYDLIINKLVSLND